MDSNDNHAPQLQKYNNLDDGGNHGDNHGKLRVVGNENTLYGCGACKPPWAQYLANPKLFTAHCTVMVATLIACFAYFGAVLTTIERQFELSSTESGSLAIINDVVSLSLVLFVSYFGHKGHRPRWLAWGAVIVAIGFFMFAMPHFASPPADPNDLIYGKTFTGASLCKLDSNLETSSEDIAAVNVTTNNTSPPVVAYCEKPSSSLGPVGWLVFGNVLTGIGQSGMYPLMTTYIDDAVGKRRLVSFTAFLFMAFAIGPACGFLLSSFTTRLYVDFDRISEDEIPDINQYDPRWIGAWWLGFVALGSVMILLAIPMFFYPKVMIDHIPEDEEEANDDDAEKDGVVDAIGGKSIFDRKDGQNGIVEIIKDLLFSIKRLFTNITLMSLTLAGSAETASIGIFGSFSVKYLQTQFGLSPGQSGMLVGALIPMNIFSNLASAWIIRRFKLTSKQCALFVIIVLSISGTMLPVLMTIGCPNQDFAGLTVPYPSDTVDEDVYRYRRTVYSLITDNPLSITKKSGADFSATCNEDCSCSNEIFQPVCDVSNGVTYISACHAGCTGQNTTYTDCSCLSSSSNGTAEQGQCPYKCDSSRLPISMVVFGVSFFIMALTGNPLIFITLRCVKDEDRSVALGFKSLITKVLGFFPSPIYFGAIINATCIYWQYTCGERGACWIYDIVKYRYSYFGTLLVLRVLGLICYVAVYLSLKPEKSKTPPNVIKYPDEALQLKSKNKSEEL